MQVFLPVKVEDAEDVKRIGEILDRPRHNKQLMECKTIIEGGWGKHPASKMYTHSDVTIASLLFYSINLALTYEERYGKMNIDFTTYLPDKEYEFELPHWFNDPYFYSYHAAALIRKSPSHYIQFQDVLTNAYNVFTIQDVNYLVRLQTDDVLKRETEKHKFNFVHNTGGEIELYEQVAAIYKKTPNIYWSWVENKYVFYPQTY